MPDRWLGFNSPGPYNIPVEDPSFVAAVARLRPHYLRFPGGTVSNYYQWRSGQLTLGDHPDHPIYKEWANRSRKMHPDGVFIEQYVDLARAAGAELVVVPNLETSSADEQAAWFAQMNADGFRPSRIEMGNEFFLALMMNPVTLGIFPDWQTTIDLTRKYVDAIRPHVADEARFAVQAAGSAFHNPGGGGDNPYAAGDGLGSALARREKQWDADMRPEPWFDAVTLHLYPTIEGSAGSGSLAELPANVESVFAACMARVDEGYCRAISDTVERMPGKEVWITEWGAYEPLALAGKAEVAFDGLWLHVITRSLLAMLRHPEVTVCTNHSLFCDGNLMSAFRKDDAGAYIPINATGIINWFCDASRGPGAHYQALAIEGSRRVTANGTIRDEGFQDVAACLFHKDPGRSTLFIQNAGTTAKEVDLSGILPSGPPVAAEFVETADLLASLQQHAPEARSTKAATVMRLPPVSIARLAWAD